ncbi:MAG: substrate-binding domain-containing protein [Acidobacteria bacterium]|nr:substrate-binding domain-containing protein [Acidobacteriota bacterium]
MLEAVEKASHPLTIQEIVAVTGIQRLAVYRLLSTLEGRGYVLRSDDKRYRATLRRRRVVVGYAAPLTGNWFRVDLTASIRQAAAQSGLDLLVLDNGEDDSAAALQNAQALVDRRVDVAMFFEPVEAIGYMVAERLMSSGIPFITIERSLQGGIYFGANNYQAGKLAGAALGQFALKHWRGCFDRIVLVEAAQTSTNVQARVSGVLVGLREKLGAFEESSIIHLDGKGHQDSSREAMAGLLPRIRPGSRLLISGFNDLSAVGALEGIRAVGREREVAIVGQNASQEARAEIRKQNSRFIASVAYFPERYGAKLLRLVSAIVNGEQAPPAVYTDHLVLSRENVDKYYPDPGGARQERKRSRV